MKEVASILIVLEMGLLLVGVGFFYCSFHMLLPFRRKDFAKYKQKLAHEGELKGDEKNYYIWLRTESSILKIGLYSAAAALVNLALILAIHKIWL